MSREIKFRAWGHLEGEDYKMIDSFNLYNHLGIHVPTVGHDHNPICDHTLMQYTGLKDKNGVEIYEGDILSEPISPVGGENGGYLYKSRTIKWEGGGSGYKLFAPQAASEVIGNIHQNPELLEIEK